MKYPANICIEDEPGRIHDGHNLDPNAISEDFCRAFTLQQQLDLHVEEVWCLHHPRIKWCERVCSFSCDRNGEWHSHWEPVRPEELRGRAYTIVRPSEAEN